MLPQELRKLRGEDREESAGERPGEAHVPQGRGVRPGSRMPIGPQRVL